MHKHGLAVLQPAQSQTNLGSESKVLISLGRTCVGSGILVCPGGQQGS